MTAIPQKESAPMASKKRSVMLVTGEASGDEHAAHVVHTLLERDPSLSVFGMGGSHVRAAGMETVVDSEKTAGVMGLVEVVGSLGGLVRAFLDLLKAADERKPEIVILLDFPDFNMRLARALHRRGVKVFYFISPQLWAWRRGRIKSIKKYVSKMATIFPFEEEFYREHGVEAEFVGHPFLDRGEFSVDKNEFCSKYGLNPERKIVAMLPGSRKSEVERLFNDMLGAVRLLQDKNPEIQPVVPVATSLDEEWVMSHAHDYPDVTFIKGEAPSVLRVADAALVASGTATVEAALSEVPFVVAYRLSPLTYVVGKLLVRGVKHFAMANLIAGKTVVPELLQDEVNPKRLAAELEPLLIDSVQRQTMLNELSKVREKLLYRGKRSGTCGDRAAHIALELMNEESQ